MRRLSYICLLIILSLCFAGCNAHFSLYAEIPDYEKVIEGVSSLPEKGESKPPEADDPNVGEEPGDPMIPVDLPVIDGYKLITEQGFETVSSFGNNSYSSVEIDGERFLVDKAGKVCPSPSDLTRLIYDKYIFEEHGYKGVKNVYGKVLIEASYGKIDICGKTVLASNSEIARVFDTSMTDAAGNVMLVCETSRSRFSSLSLYAEDLVAMDGIICGLNLRPRTYDNFEVIGEIDGFAVVVDKTGLFGYYDTVKRRLNVRPKYVSASLFLNGYATVAETFGGETMVIDTEGKEVLRVDGRTYGFYDGYMCIEDETGFLKVFDSEFNDTRLRFTDVQGKRVYNGYIIDSEKRKLYSVLKREYVSSTFSDIIPSKGGFILKTGGRAELIDFDMNLLCEADDILADGDMLCIQKNGRYYFYSDKEIVI